MAGVVVADKIRWQRQGANTQTRKVYGGNVVVEITVLLDIKRHNVPLVIQLRHFKCDRIAPLCDGHYLYDPGLGIVDLIIELGGLCIELHFVAVLKPETHVAPPGERTRGDLRNLLLNFGVEQIEDHLESMDRCGHDERPETPSGRL